MKFKTNDVIKIIFGVVWRTHS